MDGPGVPPTNRGLHGYRCLDLDSRLVDYWEKFCLLTFTNNLTQVLSEPVPRGRTSGKFPCVALILMDVDTFSSLGKGCSAGESQLDSVLHKSSLYGARSDFVTRHLSTKEEHLVASFMNF